VKAYFANIFGNIKQIMMKPIHKFNNGNGATLCHCCRKILSIGFTKELYCNNECKQRHNLKENFTMEEYYGQMENEVHKDNNNLNK
jgi:hypothetical protein